MPPFTIFRTIASLLLDDSSDLRTVEADATPGLTTLLDVSLYRSREAELVGTVCAANALLSACLDLKRTSVDLLAVIRSDCVMNFAGVVAVGSWSGVEGSSNSNGGGGGGGGGVDSVVGCEPLSPKRRGKGGGGNNNSNVNNNSKSNMNMQMDRENRRTAAIHSVVRFLVRIESFAVLCAECADEAIDKLTTDRLSMEACVDRCGGDYGGGDVGDDKDYEHDNADSQGDDDYDDDNDDDDDDDDDEDDDDSEEEDDSDEEENDSDEDEEDEKNINLLKKRNRKDKEKVARSRRDGVGVGLNIGNTSNRGNLVRLRGVITSPRSSILDTAGRRRSRAPSRLDCWESPRLHCPDYVWAEGAASHIARIIRVMSKHDLFRSMASDGSISIESDGYGDDNGNNGYSGDEYKYEYGSSSTPSSLINFEVIPPVGHSHTSHLDSRGNHNKNKSWYRPSSSPISAEANSSNNNINGNTSNTNTSPPSISNSNTSPPTAPQSVAAEVLLPAIPTLLRGLLSLVLSDLPIRLRKFRLATESDATTSKRLYLVKSEYRAPFRAFLEGHERGRSAPDRDVVGSYLAKTRTSNVNGNDGNGDTSGDRSGGSGNVSGSKSGKKYPVTTADPAISAKSSSTPTQAAAALAAAHPGLVTALAAERTCEALEIGLASTILPFSDLCRWVLSRGGRVRAIPGVIEPEDVPALEELMRRLGSVLCSSAGLGRNIGIGGLGSDGGIDSGGGGGGGRKNRSGGLSLGLLGGSGSGSGILGGSSLYPFGLYARGYSGHHDDASSASVGIRPILLDLLGAPRGRKDDREYQKSSMGNILSAIASRTSSLSLSYIQSPSVTIDDSHNTTIETGFRKQKKNFALPDPFRCDTMSGITGRIDIVLQGMKTILALAGKPAHIAAAGQGRKSIIGFYFSPTAASNSGGGGSSMGGSLHKRGGGEISGGGNSLDIGEGFIPSGLVQACEDLDEEMFRAQFLDWRDAMGMQHTLATGYNSSNSSGGRDEHLNNNIRKYDKDNNKNNYQNIKDSPLSSLPNKIDLSQTFEELAEAMRRAEFEAGIAKAPRNQLVMFHKRLEQVEKDRVLRFEVLREMVEEVCMREMNFCLKLRMPKADARLRLPEMPSAQGIFGTALNISGETLQLG